jgi:hypothetical protein
MANLESAIKNIQKKAIDYKTTSQTIFEGKNNLTGSALTSATTSQKIKDKGVINILELVASTDLCSILNFVNQQTTDSKGFDPDKLPPPNNAPTLQKNKYAIQKKAYEIQKSIDDYYAKYGDAISLGSNEAFFSLVKQLYSDLSELQKSLQDTELTKTYRILSLFINYINEINNLIQILPFQFGGINAGANFEVNPTILKLKREIDNLRAVCVSIQNIPDSPEELAVYAFSAMSPALMEQIKELSKVLDPKKLIPTITAIINTCRSIYQVLSIVQNIIKFSQFIITISVVFIKIFSIISKFLEALPLPAMFSSVGIQTTLSSFNEKLKKFIEKFKGNIDQISLTLDYIVDFVEYLLINLEIILQRLEAIKQNFDSCDNIDRETLDNLNKVINDLSSSKDNLNKFISNYREKLKTQDNNYGKYTLTIIQEQTSNSSIRFKRRYGVALDNNGILIAQTDLTFASLDSVIYEELKLKLSSLGLAPKNLLESDLQLSVYKASLFLEDTSILEDLSTTNFNQGMDPQDNEDESDGIGLNAFINKLNGGKRLRKRVQDAMIAANQKLNKDLNKVNK